MLPLVVSSAERTTLPEVALMPAEPRMIFPVSEITVTPAVALISPVLVNVKLDWAAKEFA